MAVGYFLATVGTLLELVLDSADMLNNSDFKEQLSQALANHPAVVSRVFLVISILVILARLRGILGWRIVPKDHD